MKRLLAALVGAALIGMPLAVISTPVAAQTPSRHVQTDNVKQVKKAHKAKAKHKARKSKKAKRSASASTQ